jgi:hypothetical protein
MTITVTIARITSHPTGNESRPIFIEMEAVANIEGEVFTAPWYICMEEINRRFPGVKFTGGWVGNTCTFMETTSAHYVESPENPLFFVEV